MADNDIYELFEEKPSQTQAPELRSDPDSMAASGSAPVLAATPEPPAEDVREDAEIPGLSASRETTDVPAPVAAAPAAESGEKEEHAGFSGGAFRAKDIPREAIRVHDVPGDVDLATYLRTLRTENGLTLDALAACTGISKNYLAALESDDFSELPPIAYALAYVRRLGALYQVPEDRMPLLSSALRARLEPELPEDMSKSIVDHAESEENVRRIRQLALVLGTAGILIVITLILGGLLLWAGIRRHNAGQNQPFHRPILMEMQGEPRLQVPVSAVPSR